MIARIVRRLAQRSGGEGNYWVMESPQLDHVGIHRGSVERVMTVMGRGQGIVRVYGTDAFHRTNRPARWL